jgi:hypothetical protein
MPLIERMEPYWTVGGWIVAGASFVLALLFVSIIFPYMSSHTGGADAAIRDLGSNPKIGIVRVLYLLANLGGLAFIALDAINRRGNLLWLLPQAICGCTGFTWVILPIYLLAGRNK